MQAGIVPGAEAPRIDALAELRPSELPRPSDVALRVMHACADPDSNARGIAKLVSGSPSLTAELLQIVNSAYFGFAGKITSVTQAVAILGQRSLRHYVLCLAVRDALDTDAMHGSDLSAFWRASFGRAVAARILGQAKGIDPDESFTAGLLLDIGLAALFHTRPDQIGHLQAFMQEDPEVRLEREREIFGVTHDRVGAMLAQAWGLPDRLVSAIGGHHGLNREPGEGSHDATLAKVALVADWVATICQAEARRSDVERAFEIAALEIGLERSLVTVLLGNLPAEIAGAAAAFGFELPPTATPETLLRDANLALIEEHVSIQELNWRLQNALDERDAFGERLRGELETARIVQRSLLPPCTRADCAGPFSGLNAPAHELSGDFYDHFTLVDGRSFFCLADVSGKGMDAALLMAKTSGLFHCLAKLVHDPAKLLALINSELVETSVRGMFVTMVAGVYDPEACTVDIVNAGHPPGLLVDSDGEVTILETQSPPLGIVPCQRYEAERYAVDGRTLYLFSDGLIEATDPSGSHLGYSGVVRVLRENASTTRTELPARVLTGVQRTHDLTADDVTLLVLEG